MLAATPLGLGTVCVRAFDDAVVQFVLGTHDLLPVAILSIGYPAVEPEPTARRSLADLAKTTPPAGARGETGVSGRSR
jgi:nitroreductase